MTLLQLLLFTRSFVDELIAREKRSIPPEKVGFVQFITYGEHGFMTTVNPPNILLGGSLGFVLNGVVSAGDTFVEPTVQLGGQSGDGNQATGTVTLQPSATAPTDGSQPVSPVPAGYVGNFTTQGTFVSDGVTPGQAALHAEVLGVDDSDAVFQVQTPTPETVGFDPTQFTVTAPGGTQASVAAPQAASAALAPAAAAAGHAAAHSAAQAAAKPTSKEQLAEAGKLSNVKK